MFVILMPLSVAFFKAGSTLHRISRGVSNEKAIAAACSGGFAGSIITASFDLSSVTRYA